MKQNRDMPTRKFEIKFCKVYARQKPKSQSGAFIYTFSKNLCFNS